MTEGGILYLVICLKVFIHDLIRRIVSQSKRKKLSHLMCLVDHDVVQG